MSTDQTAAPAPPAASAPLPMATMDWATLVLLAAIWGGSFFFAKVAVVEIPPLLLVLRSPRSSSSRCWARRAD